MLVSSNPAFLAYLGFPISHIGQNPKNARCFLLIFIFPYFPYSPGVGWPYPLTPIPPLGGCMVTFLLKVWGVWALGGMLLKSSLALFEISMQGLHETPCFTAGSALCYPTQIWQEACGAWK